jgi:hypothetical protein
MGLAANGFEDDKSYYSSMGDGGYRCNICQLVDGSTKMVSDLGQEIIKVR